MRPIVQRTLDGDGDDECVPPRVVCNESDESDGIVGGDELADLLALAVLSHDSLLLLLRFAMMAADDGLVPLFTCFGRLMILDAIQVQLLCWWMRVVE